MITLFICTTVFFLCTTIILLFACRNLLTKLESAEKWISTLNQSREFFGNSIESIYLRMKALDENGMFSSDDDVGFAFSEILKLIETFNNDLK